MRELVRDPLVGLGRQVRLGRGALRQLHHLRRTKDAAAKLAAGWGGAAVAEEEASEAPAEDAPAEEVEGSEESSAPEESAADDAADNAAAED